MSELNKFDSMVKFVTELYSHVELGSDVSVLEQEFNTDGELVNEDYYVVSDTKLLRDVLENNSTVCFEIIDEGLVLKTII